MGDCLFVEDPDKQALESKSSDEDDDDEEDEDEDEPKKLKISNLAKLMCSQKKLINDKIAENQEMINAVVEEKTKSLRWFKLFSDIRNAQLMCSGIGYEYPKLRITKDHKEGMLALRVNIAGELFPSLDWTKVEEWRKTGDTSEEHMFWKEHMEHYKLSKY